MIDGAMEITTVIGCRMMCVYCPQSKLTTNYLVRSKDTIMSLDVFKKCIDKIPEKTRIHFSGISEQWLYPDCTEMLLYAWKRNHPITVYSTLIGMDNEDFVQIRHIPFTTFIIHLPDAENKSNIPITPKYLQLLQDITRFFNESPNRQNFGASCHGNIHPAVLQAIGNDAFNSNLNQGVYSQMHDRAGNLETMEITHRNIKGPIKCNLTSRILNKNVLLPNGDVLLCCMDYGMEYILGNLLVDEYFSIFESSTILSVIERMDDDSRDLICRHCFNAVAA
jgi:sulfatase maturation enzyme AslB (radical SAM superfamily)